MLPDFVKTEDRLVNRSITLYGPTKSGKTYLTHDLMNYLRQFIPNVVVIAPSEISNQSYSTIVPRACIHAAISKVLLERIWIRQQDSAQVYRNASSLDVLKTLFAMVPDASCRMEIESVERKVSEYTANVSKIDSRFITDIERQNTIKKFQEEAAAHIIKSLKKHLDKHASEYKKIAGQLSEQQLFCFTYRKFNPNVLLVCDDVGGDLKTLLKDPMVKNMFFMGRHFYITIIITAQDDGLIEKNLRKQITTNIFTHPQSVIHYFKMNDFTSDVVEKGTKQAIATLGNKFDEKTFKPLHFKQLVYLREENSFFVYEARHYDGFRFGSPELWRLCDGVAEKKMVFKQDDPFMKTARDISLAQ